MLHLAALPAQTALSAAGEPATTGQHRSKQPTALATRRQSFSMRVSVAGTEFAARLQPLPQKPAQPRPVFMEIHRVSVKAHRSVLTTIFDVSTSRDVTLNGGRPPPPKLLSGSFSHCQGH